MSSNESSSWEQVWKRDYNIWQKMAESDRNKSLDCDSLFTHLLCPEAVTDLFVSLLFKGERYQVIKRSKGEAPFLRGHWMFPMSTQLKAPMPRWRLCNVPSLSCNKVCFWEVNSIKADKRPLAPIKFGWNAEPCRRTHTLSWGQSSVIYICIMPG